MYIENLTSPNTLNQPDAIEPVPLLGVLDITSVRERLAAVSTPYEYLQTVIREADVISRTVNRALTYRTRHSIQNGLNPDVLAAEQTADCFGYTIVLSECLEAAGIDHFLAYSNGHGFAVVGDAKTSLWMIDALSPCLNNDMTPALNENDFKRLPSQLATYQRGLVRFHSSLYAKSLPLKDTFETLSGKNPWMRISKSVRDPRCEPDELSRDQTLVVLLHEPELGRQVFEDVRNFEALCAKGSYSEAYRTLKRMHGVFPEIDSRNKLPTVRNFIRRLATKGYLDLARKATDSVAESFRPELSADQRLATWRGDTLRDIGRIAQSPEILAEAVSSYQAIENSESPLIQGKIQKTQKILRAI